MALVSRASTRVPCAMGTAALPARPLRLVLARAEPPTGGAKVTREFREGDSEVTVPGAPTARKQSDGLYVDADAPPMRPRPGNLSKEMKARLRAEYTGLGGAENREVEAPVVLPSSPRMPIIIAAAAVETREAAPSGAEAEAGGSFAARPDGATDLAAEASTSAARPGSSKWVIEEGENLKSTPEMRAWTWVSIAMIAATLEQATRQIAGPEDVVVFGGAVLLAYILADLGTGIYHWGVDNYGDGNTPVFGRQIAAFQGHHQRPWTITQREFANNLHQVFGPASYPAAGLLALSPVMPLGWNAWSSSFLFLVCMSQQFHAWSHMKKSELHPAVVALQDAGVLIGRREHGAHHKAPFEGNYSIVSGWWNPLLDSSGFFRKMEKVIHDATGVAPRCWADELPADWQEQERPGHSSSAEAEEARA
ncbi:hypothetical protein GPECTOR_2g1130 [Gonium pectorale]|uniref:Lipid desaturase domain-containing protein n=1 Tax=Gonium pectorale TaxID=33097 RepID=A0A150H0G8_GONPE|nr:hypothetical protein GPECTOR_2g1130 [Gonium pectorale]|eukprot:KXZ55581.1 hypothetical protein GPECTOR_2g1130 [Gonium pectorale]